MIVWVGKVYDYYDGKSSPSRRYDVKIVEKIPFSAAEETLVSEWEDEAGNCPWLYAKETDYFLRAALSLRDGEKEEIFFVRTLDGGWFSMGLWSGRLKKKPIVWPWRKL